MQRKVSGGQPTSITYVEKPGLLGLSIKNFLLNMVTLTLYRFWAKTNVRRHVWSSVKINNDPLEYTGTGKELFLGALIIFAVLILPLIVALIVIQFWFGPEHPVTILSQVAFALIGFLLWGMAIYRARRYRLSRTLWRGIRGTLAGSSMSFSLLYFGAMLLRGMTLGWSTPAMNLNIQERLTGDMKFGESPFYFRGPAGPLYGRYALCWFATPIVLLIGAVLIYYATGFNPEVFKDMAALEESTDKPDLPAGALVAIFGFVFLMIAGYGLVWTLYTAREMSVFAQYTRFSDAQFKLDATAGSLVVLWLGNMAILLFTLGIGQPYVMQRMARYVCNRLSVVGSIDIAAIQQSTAAMDKHGEGLLDAFDVDGF